MYTVNYAISTNQEIMQHFLQMDVKTIEQEIGKLPLEKIALVVSGINENADPSWRQKLRALFHGLSQRDPLQECGRALNTTQAMEILDMTRELESVHHWKLLPLMVGLSNKVFEKILFSASPEQLQVIKLEGITESIQHHLTALLHEWAKEVETHSSVLHTMIKEISVLEPEKMARQEVSAIEALLATTSDSFHQISVKVSKALAIAWNTNRADLIEKMTALKESSLKYSSVVIGHPHTQAQAATGLYGLLDKRLDTVYGNATETTGEGDALEDDDPAIEGLAKLKVWYLHDYWEIGLLPGIEEPEVVEQEQQSIADKVHIKERECLYFLALDNLQRLGLSLVRDLKEASIYSKEMLVDYIKEHRRLLISKKQ